MMEASDQTKAVRVSIWGRVQGVWFRAWTKEQADSLGLSGWVRNRRDGSVEALFLGAGQAVDQMIERCWQGSPASHVEAVDMEPAQGIAANRFEVKPTV